MGKIKDLVIREEEAVAAVVGRRLARVSVGGGDAMSGGMMAILASLEEEAAAKGLTLEQLALQEEEAYTASAAVIPLKSAENAAVAAKVEPASTLPAPPEEAAVPEVLFEMPPQDYMKKGLHFKLVFQGVCSNCAHCALKLTDAVSIERGIGPICSKRGYFEDPTDPDEMQAMIDLAEYPELVNYLVTKYKVQTDGKARVRSLMNGLVKICSLNRRSPVHQACCDAVESLGYKTLASTLRESIAVIEIKEHDASMYNVWVKKSEWHYAWQRDLRSIPGAYLSRQAKGWLVNKTQKQLLWAYMIKHYAGFCATVRDSNGVKKTVKITPTIKPPASQPTVATAP